MDPTPFVRSTNHSSCSANRIPFRFVLIHRLFFFPPLSLFQQQDAAKSLAGALQDFHECQAVAHRQWHVSTIGHNAEPTNHSNDARRAVRVLLQMCRVMDEEDVKVVAKASLHRAMVSKHRLRCVFTIDYFPEQL
jgi:hypothetical protein